MLYRNMLNKYYAPEGEEPQPGATAPEAEVPDLETLQATIAKMKEENERMSQHQAVLLKEKKQEQDRRREQEEARQKAELESQKKAGDLEGLEKSLLEQFGTKETKYASEIERLNSMILGGKKSEIIAELAGDFVSPEAAKLMLSALVSTEHGENNTVSTSFKGLDGQLITTDRKAFKEYLMSNEAFSPYLKGPDSSGGMGLGGKPSAGGGKANAMKRSDFEQCSPADQMTFIKNGGKITN